MTTTDGLAITGTTTYTFDELNRMQTVTDPNGGVTTYTYALNGKPDTVTQANGTVADHDYDTLGRLTYLENRKADTTLISSYTYTLDANGNRTHVSENGTGGTPVRDVDYGYDALNRLTSETIIGATATTYTYDDVGNRLAKETCSGDPLVCATTTYDYNANNQLVSEDGPDPAKQLTVIKPLSEPIRP